MIRRLLKTYSGSRFGCQELRVADRLASIGHDQGRRLRSQTRVRSSTAETAAPAESHFQLSWKKLIT